MGNYKDEGFWRMRCLVFLIDGWFDMFFIDFVFYLEVRVGLGVIYWDIGYERIVGIDYKRN